MLNRRILRIKAFKVLYAYAEDHSLSLKDAQANLKASCEATRNLYLFMLALIPSLTREAGRQAEALMGKFNPTHEELHPNPKFMDNALARLLEEDPDFNKIISRKKLSWEQYDVYLRELYAHVSGTAYFKAYMESDDRSLKADVKLFERMFEDGEAFVDNARLEAILQELSILWVDDLAYALTQCCKTLRELAKGERWCLPPLWNSEIIRRRDPDVDSDEKFVTRLVAGAYSGYDRYAAMVAESVPSWDSGRLFTSDLVLIALGLAEAVTFPEIPVRVSINEYVEITKYYSTPKSCSFVNGLLDKLIGKLVEDGEIVKSGRGLL